jgi:phosphoribosylformylglycinamidine (FGAM) synthase-like enzyme
MTSASDVMTFENAATMGLSRDEWDLINQRLGRTPNFVSLAFFRPCGRSIVRINHQRNG